MVFYKKERADFFLWFLWSNFLKALNVLCSLIVNFEFSPIEAMTNENMRSPKIPVRTPIILPSWVTGYILPYPQFSDTYDTVHKACTHEVNSEWDFTLDSKIFSSIANSNSMKNSIKNTNLIGLFLSMYLKKRRRFDHRKISFLLDTSVSLESRLAELKISSVYL